MSALDALGQTMLFGALDEEYLHNLAAVCISKSHDKGSLVLVEGDPGGDILVLASGRLKVLTRSPEGTDMVLTTVVPGDTLGELSLFDREPRSATVEAQIKSVVITVPHDAAWKVIHEHPDLAEEIMRQQAQMLRRLTGMVSDLVFLDLPRRVAKYILDRADHNDMADLGLSQTELAAAVGAVRQSVNTALRGFERRGWIKVEGRVVDIRDKTSLEDYVAAGR